MALLTQLQRELPVQYVSLDLRSSEHSRAGLVVIDEVNGFCTVGAGNLAPTVHDEQISSMVAETDRIARLFSQRGLPILVTLDTHYPDRPEPPYPPHCIEGTGEENLVPDLEWLASDSNAQLMRKDCINSFIGAYQKDGSNTFIDWIRRHQINSSVGVQRLRFGVEGQGVRWYGYEGLYVSVISISWSEGPSVLEIKNFYRETHNGRQLVVVGICTDICVLDFALAALSARNHGMLDPLKQVAIYSKACATYDLPMYVANDIGSSAHPQDLTHHIGLYTAASRGADIVETLIF